MEHCKLSQQAHVFTFDNIADYLTHIYLIEKKTRYYLIDTYCGPDSIREALGSIKIDPHKEFVVINSHFHWDHVWGNCVFKDSLIISHELCRTFLAEHWAMQIAKNGNYLTGLVEKTLPNCTFTDKLIFRDDGLELFYSPGHTQDSISVYDWEEKILYTGDNLEKPIIYVEDSDLSTYISTLENYLSYKAQKIFSGHTLDLTREDILATIKYLKALESGEEIGFTSEYEQSVHQENLLTLNRK